MASAENMVIHAAASVAFAAGVPAYVWQSGQFTGVITDTGVGDISLNLNANDGCDVLESAILTEPRGALANWPRQVCINCVHTTDIAKQILISEEGVAGAVSVAADINFDVAILKRNIL